MTGAIAIDIIQFMKDRDPTKLDDIAEGIGKDPFEVKVAVLLLIDTGLARYTTDWKVALVKPEDESA